MGMQDRDYYREWRNKVDQDAKPYRPKPPSTSFWYSHARDDAPGLPDVPGANWHWATQVLVWLAVIAALFLVFKVVENRQAQRRALVLQQQQIEHQKKQIEELQKAMQQKPKVDFFK